MAAAKKYFSPEEEKKDDSTAGQKSDGGLIEKVIEKVNKKANEEYFSNKQADGYVVPIPEKISPDSQAGSLDDVVQGKPSPGRKGNGNGNNQAKPISPIPSSGLYIVGELFEKFRNSMVKDPMSPTYQVARKIGDKIIKESSDSYGILLKEATNIGIYVLIEVILGKKYLKG